jgi:hypothetical protein
VGDDDIHAALANQPADLVEPWPVEGKPTHVVANLGYDLPSLTFRKLSARLILGVEAGPVLPSLYR